MKLAQRLATTDEVAATLGLDADTVAAGWHRLHDAHALVHHLTAGAVPPADHRRGAVTRGEPA